MAMADEPKQDDTQTSCERNGCSCSPLFMMVILCFAVAFCDGRDGKDLHDALIESVSK